MNSKTLISYRKFQGFRSSMQGIQDKNRQEQVLTLNPNQKVSSHKASMEVTVPIPSPVGNS